MTITKLYVRCNNLAPNAKCYLYDFKGSFIGVYKPCDSVLTGIEVSRFRIIDSWRVAVYLDTANTKKVLLKCS